MKKIIIALLLALLAWFGLSETSFDKSSQNSVPTSSTAQSVEVQYVIDGDTFVLKSGEKVRLIGIDTPEREDKYYAEATVLLRSLIDNKTVRLEADMEDQDRYDRLLRYVYIDDLLVNEALVRAGLAEAKTYRPNTTLQDRLQEAEDYARAEKLGLWQ